MKTRYKISIIIPIVIVILFFLLPATYLPIICDDKILGQDDCGNYLEEKYSKLSQVEHFREMYPDPPGLGFKTIMFKAVSAIATSSMEEKRIADLEINLEDSTITYRCYDLTMSHDDHITVDITNPTIEDMNNNYCLGQRK